MRDGTSVISSPFANANERLRVGVALAGAILLSVPRVPPGEGAGGRVQERVLVLETQTREPRRAWGAHALTGLSSFVRRSYSCSAAGRRGTVGSEPDQDNGRRSGALQRFATVVPFRFCTLTFLVRTDNGPFGRSFLRGSRFGHCAAFTSFSRHVRHERDSTFRHSGSSPTARRPLTTAA